MKRDRTWEGGRALGGAKSEQNEYLRELAIPTLLTGDGSGGILSTSCSASLQKNEWVKTKKTKNKKRLGIL